MKAYNQFCHQLVHLDGTQKGLEQTPQIQEFHCASCQTSQIPKVNESKTGYLSVYFRSTQKNMHILKIKRICNKETENSH